MKLMFLNTCISPPLCKLWHIGVAIVSSLWRIIMRREGNPHLVPCWKILSQCAMYMYSQQKIDACGNLILFSFGQMPFLFNATIYFFIRIVFWPQETENSKQEKSDFQILISINCYPHPALTYASSLYTKILAIEFSKDHNIKLYTYLQAQFPDHQLEEVVLVSFHSGNIFIQTDKTVYTPGSTGKSRTTSLLRKTNLESKFTHSRTYLYTGGKG